MPESETVSGKRELFFEEEDLQYEEEILRNPFSVKCWIRYIDFKQNAPKHILNLIYERALKELPGSYKLWYNYLKQRRKQVKSKCVTDPCYEEVNNCHERALVFMHKMPRIWLDYCQFLMDQCRITRTRRTFDRALRALPITQHHRIWPLYLKFVRLYPLPETAVRVYRRYLKLSPENAEEYIEYLHSIDRLDEAAVRLGAVVNDERFVSKEGKSNYQLWHELCDLISQNPDKVKSLNVGAIIRGGLTRFTDQLGKLWCSLADYYIRSGHFEKARDVYEEAIQTVMTVRDFTQVFDSYAQFEESMIAAKMETTSEMGREEDDDVDLELRLARFEQLITRRPLLLNSVLLRQNPHNVHEWHKRVKLYEGKPWEIINTYTEAVQTVDPFKATGKSHTLWVSFAKFYETNGQIEDARTIFEKATKVNFKQVDELASVWCEYGEMELRHENYDQALRILRKATAIPAKKAEYFDSTEPVQNRVYKSLKVWSMLADLEESLGTFKSTKAVYDRILDLRIATPQIIINYGLFLEEHKYFEESFKAYERGISLFKWPNVYDIWNTYLTKFIDRYGGKKLERARDLFEQALDGCPQKYAKTIYLLYAKLEEEYGLARHAMAVYERATQAVLPAEKHDMYNIYIKRAAEIYGVTHTRSIYEKAIEVLSDEHAREMCLRFADMECKLGEIDRARAIYSYCSQMCDPRTTANFWQTWKEFEIRHGNEDGNGTGTVPLHYSLAKIISVTDNVSRCNAPSNCLQIFKELKGYKPAGNTTSISIVLVAEYADVLASVAAISRAFPTFSLKTSENKLKEINVEVVVTDGKTLGDADVDFLNTLTQSIRETVRLIDTPANILTTDALVDEALAVAKELGNVETTVINGEELKQKGFGGIYHVGKAGPTPPAFVVLSYKPAGSNHTYALVGKGIVYDTGGLQIKGKTGMPNMKRDMGGAAGMLHSFRTLVKSGFKQNLHCLLCIAENNISPIANKPDDIITMLSGKTCEVNNTDAEGRLVLADGVFYAKTKLGADTIIDMATLTGAQAYLSGKLHSAVMTNIEELEHKAEVAGRRSGDLVKSMLFAPDLHFPDLNSPVADMKNSNLGKMEGPPSAIAGLFIGSHIDFGEGINWLHFDIAAPAESGDRGTGYGPTLFSAMLGKETVVPLLQ